MGHSGNDHVLGGSFPYHPGETSERGVFCLKYPDNDHGMGGSVRYHPGETFEGGLSGLTHPDKDHDMGGSFPYHPGETFGEGVSCRVHPDEDNELEGFFPDHPGDGHEGPTPALFGTHDGGLLAGKATSELLEADHHVGVTVHELPSALSTNRVRQFEVSGDKGVGSFSYHQGNNLGWRASFMSHSGNDNEM